MIELDDPRWRTLSHAYGSAADVPELLRQLAGATGPTIGDDEPWFTLWSSLCHQGDVYDASYAAVPHIVEIACNTSGPIDFSFFQLPAAIEVARHGGKGPSVPTELADAYVGAVSRLTECVALHRHEDWDEATLLSAASALAAAKGHHRVAEAIMNLDDDLITRLIALDFGSSLLSPNPQTQPFRATWRSRIAWKPTVRCREKSSLTGTAQLLRFSADFRFPETRRSLSNRVSARMGPSPACLVVGALPRKADLRRCKKLRLLPPRISTFKEA